MKRTLLLCAIAMTLAGCGGGGDGSRVMDAGPCLVTIERTVCHPTGGAPLCVPEAFLAVRRTPQCLPIDRERGA